METSFTKDPVIRDHQLWIGFAQPEGLVVSPAALKNAQAVLSRNVGPQQEILRRNAVSDFDGNLRLKNFPAFTQEFWGWRDTDLATPPEDLFARLPEYGETLRPTWVVRGGKGQPEHLILVEELPWGTDFDKAVQQAEERRWQASPQARFERLLRETGVGIGLLTSPERIRLVYAPKGESSGHVTFPVHQMTMAVNWPLPAALHLLLHSDRLFIGPETQRLPAILEASRRYQNEVSIRLAGQVLRALNELVRGFQEADRAAKGRILGEALQHDPSHIYGGMLTTLMRMVFVLYAEDRSLMGSDETWLQNYSISGLYERLRADAGQYPDTMDSRYGAWAQIITLTRLLYDGGGHGTWRLPPRHGGLFDPDAYPFLEGRPWQSKRVAGERIEAPLVSDGILFRILQDLLYLGGERISYRALDVEQIGSVYEAMMGFTVETAHGVSIGLGSDHLVIDLEDLLTKMPDDRAKWLTDKAACDVTGKAIEQLSSASRVDELLAALRRRISKLYLDQSSNPVVVPRDGIYLQPTEERRRSGSHYTPRHLTQPIVKTTLDPVLAQLGDNPRPEQILALKVCDPAMGSGAFLVEACRYLGEKLEKAWIAHDQMPGIPADQDPLLHARRMVAQRCLYGVDKNPFAVNLAKLSLWLGTFAKDHPFTFVDHALRCGDSLVGLTAHQIEAFHWQPKEEGALLRDLPSRLRHILAARAQILDAADETPYETLAQKLAVTDDQLIDIRLSGDLTLAAFFAAEKTQERFVRRKELAEKFRRAQEKVTDLDLEDELRGIVRVFKDGPKGVTPFHWETEFPEAFERQYPGFDAIIGNPPFMWGNRVSRILGDAYRDWLLELHANANGNSDLVAHFLRRSFGMLRPGGALGLVATNTISETDTRATGLEAILDRGGVIFAASRNCEWAGAANVRVATVFVSRGIHDGPYELDGRYVTRIGADLRESSGSAGAAVLAERAHQSFKGVDFGGTGFLISPEARDAIIAASPNEAAMIWPVLNGKTFNSSATCSPEGFIINFTGLSAREAEAATECMKLVREHILPERLRAKRKANRERWWLYNETRPGMYGAIAGLPRVLVGAVVSKHIAFAFVNPRIVFTNTLNVFAFASYSVFALLQSRVHELWALQYASSLRTDPRYNPTDCFETFPFPEKGAADSILNTVGKAYYEFRAALMIKNNEGLTKTYNRFHDPNCGDSEVLRLRELHGALDRAVLDAYGWTDLCPTLDFILDNNDKEEEESSNVPDRKRRWRYRWVDEDRDEIFARLLKLNRSRAEDEAQGLTVTKPAGKDSRKAMARSLVTSRSLFDPEEPTE